MKVLKNIGFSACALLPLVAGCVKISGFDKPYAQESYLGQPHVQLGVEGLASDALATSLVIVSSDENGEYVAISGIPSNEPINIIPIEALNAAEHGKMTVQVSGLRGRVVNSDEIEIIGFYDESTLAKKIEFEVSGRLLREGMRLSVVEPIEVYANLGKIREEKILTPLMYSRLIDKETGLALDELEDDYRISILAIGFTGEAGGHVLSQGPSKPSGGEQDSQDKLDFLRRSIWNDNRALRLNRRNTWVA